MYRFAKIEYFSPFYSLIFIHTLEEIFQFESLSNFSLFLSSLVLRIVGGKPVIEASVESEASLSTGNKPKGELCNKEM